MPPELLSPSRVQMKHMPSIYTVCTYHQNPLSAHFLSQQESAKSRFQVGANIWFYLLMRRRVKLKKGTKNALLNFLIHPYGYMKTQVHVNRVISVFKYKAAR